MFNLLTYNIIESIIFNFITNLTFYKSKQLKIINICILITAILNKI